MKALESMGYVALRDYNYFVRFNMFKGKYYRLKTLALILLSFITAVYFVLYGLSGGGAKYFVIAGIIALCFFMFFYVCSTTVKNICKQNAKTVRARQRVLFGKDGFLMDLICAKEEDNEYNEVFFKEIDRIYFAPKAIYIYIDKRSVIIMPKRNLNMSPIEAREFLKKYVPAQKLVVCV